MSTSKRPAVKRARNLTVFDVQSETSKDEVNDPERR